MTPAFGRRSNPDPRDHQYLMRRKLAAPGTTIPSKKTWAIGSKSLDQGNTSTCVGHAWKNWARCAPIRSEAGPTAQALYRAAVLLDPWPENDNEAQYADGDPRQDDGTSVRAGAEAMLQTGRLKTYLWAFSLQSVVEWVLTKGPVVLGTNWYSSMTRPVAGDLCRITPTATLEGGHAFLLRGIDTRKALALCENSWGDDWGKKGGFFLTLGDLERLILEDGEACTAIETKLTKLQVPA